jgi:predicted nucleic acid-binding protein
VILADSSVWIDHLKGTHTDSVVRLRGLLGAQQLLVGDLILCEVLRGVGSEAEALRVAAILAEFDFVVLGDRDIAIKAAGNYRALRERGITMRTTVDLIIGTFCIERGHALLHSDRDFEPMERFLGLQTV